MEEAASAQAVKRGHQVTMIKVPDNEDDTSFQEWIKSGSPMIFPKQHISTLLTPPDSPTIPTKTPKKPLNPISLPPNEGVGPMYVRKDKVTSPTVATPSVAGAKVEEAPHQWM